MMYEKIARFYDLIHADLTVDIDYVLRLAASVCHEGGTVLELGCGTGRMLLPIARAGYNVIGVDKSPAMLARARQRLGAESQALQDSVRLIQADMSEFDLTGDDEQMALVAISYNTFMHLNPGQMVSTLRRVGRLLQKDGRLFIDLINPVGVAGSPNDGVVTLERRLIDPETGEQILQMASNRIDVDIQVLRITWMYDVFPDGGGIVRRTVADAAYHYLYPHQIELLLEEADLELEMLAGSYDNAPFGEDSDRMLVLARMR